jgi:6-pyruvoyl-tetrahydropterin synthase
VPRSLPRSPSAGRIVNDDAIVLDIGAAGGILEEMLADLNYKNLDEHPAFKGKLSTTEALAKHIADAMAARIQDTADGPALTGIDVVLRENPDAWAGTRWSSRSSRCTSASWSRGMSGTAPAATNTTPSSPST